MSGPLGSNLMMQPSGASNFYDYQIEQSVRLDRASGSYFSRTPGSGTSRKKFTLSTWIKKSENLDNSGEFGIVFNSQFSTFSIFNLIFFSNSVLFLTLFNLLIGLLEKMYLDLMKLIFCI